MLSCTCGLRLALLTPECLGPALAPTALPSLYPVQEQREAGGMHFQLVALSSCSLLLLQGWLGDWGEDIPPTAAARELVSQVHVQ